LADSFIGNRLAECESADDPDAYGTPLLALAPSTITFIVSDLFLEIGRDQAGVAVPPFLQRWNDEAARADLLRIVRNE
jgi:hypothetical protein